MSNPESQWSSKQIDRIELRIRELGYAGIEDILKRCPVIGYGALAQKLADDIAPIQLIAMQFREARKNGTIRNAAKDSLTRNLKEALPNGWGMGANSEWNGVRSLASWCSEVQVTGECSHLRPQLLAVASCLRHLPPPLGWIPAGPDDELIEQVFVMAWDSQIAGG